MRSVLYTSEGEMIVLPPPPPPPGIPPRSSPRNVGTRSIQYGVGIPPPPPPGPPPASSPRKRTRQRKEEYNRQPPNPDYHHRLSGRETKSRQTGIKSTKKDDRVKSAIKNKREVVNFNRPVDNSRKDGASIIEARRKAALALYESTDVQVDNDSGFVVPQPPSLRDANENDCFYTNDSIEQRKGLFRKFTGRSTKKHLPKNPSSPSGRRMKKNRSKLGIPFGAKPGSSYKSTPHSAEIVPRKAAHIPLTNTDGEFGKSSLFESFSPPRFDPPSSNDVTVDDISHLTDPTYGSPPKKRSTHKMMGLIEESGNQGKTQREPTGQRYDSDSFFRHFYAEEDFDKNSLRVLADDVESLATTHTTSVNDAISGKHDDLKPTSLNVKKDNVERKSNTITMKKAEERMVISQTGTKYNVDDDSVSRVYCHGEAVNNSSGVCERLFVGGLTQVEAIEETTKTPKVRNLSQNEQLYPEEISDRIFGAPTSIDAVKDVSSTVEFQKALENDARDRTWEDLETPRTSNKFVVGHQRDVEDAPQVIPDGNVPDPSTWKSPVSSNAKAHNDYARDSSDDTKTTVTLSPESNLSDDLSSTTWRQSGSRDSTNTTAKLPQGRLRDSNINVTSCTSVHSSTEDIPLQNSFYSENNHTAENTVSTDSSVASQLYHDSSTSSKQATKEIRIGEADSQTRASSIASKLSNDSSTVLNQSNLHDLSTTRPKQSSSDDSKNAIVRNVEALEREHEASSMTTASKISHNFSVVASHWNKEPYRDGGDNVIQAQEKGDQVWNDMISDEELERSFQSNDQGFEPDGAIGLFHEEKKSKLNLFENGQNVKDTESSGPQTVEPSTCSRNLPRKPEELRLSSLHTNRPTQPLQVSHANESIISSITSDSSTKTTNSPGPRTSPLSKRQENIMRLERLRKKQNVKKNEKLQSSSFTETTSSTDRCERSKNVMIRGTAIAKTGATSIALGYLRKNDPKQSKSKNSHVSEASSTSVKCGPPTPETVFLPRPKHHASPTSEKSSELSEDLNAKHLYVKPKVSSENSGIKLQVNEITIEEKSGKVPSFRNGPFKPEQTMGKRKKSHAKNQFEIEQSKPILQLRSWQKESLKTRTSTDGKLSFMAKQVQQKRYQPTPGGFHTSAGKDIVPSPKRRLQMRLPIRHSSCQKHDASRSIANLRYIKQRKSIIEPRVVAIGLSVIHRNRRVLIEKGYASPIQSTPRKKRLVTQKRESEIEMDESKMDPIQRAGFRVLSKSAVCIQTHYRQRIAYQETIKRLWAVIQIQSIFRRWRCEAYLYAHTWAATRIQTVFRGWKARDSVEEMQFCAIEIQRMVRGHLASIRIYDDIYRILLLQSMIRRCLARKRAMRRLGAAIILQAVCRSFVVRLEMRKAVGAATRIQTFLRAKLTLQEKKDNHCATKIQAQWRRYQSQTRCLYKLVHIIIVQSTVRRWLVVTRIRNSRTKYLSAKIKQKRFHSAATKIQATWRCFWEYTQYLIMNYEIVRVQAVVRGFQARIGASLQMGCAIMIQSAIRRYFAQKSVEERKMEIVTEASYMLYLREKSAAICIQKGLLNCKKQRTEKRAAATIQRFFIMVKAEVDREIRRHSVEMKRKAVKLKKGQFTASVIEEEKMLEGAWLHVVHNSSLATAPMKRTAQLDPPVSGAPPGFGDTPGKHVYLGSRREFVETTHINKSMVDPLTRQADNFSCGMPKRQNYSDVGRRDQKSNVSTRMGGGPFIQSNHSLSPSYHTVNVQSRRREIKQHEKVYEATTKHSFNRTFPARLSTLSCQELSEDLSLEEAWIDTEVRQVKEHVQQMRSVQKNDVEMQGLDQSGSEESPNLRRRLYVEAKAHSFECHGKSEGQFNQDPISHENRLTNQDEALNHAQSREEQVVVAHRPAHNNINDRYKPPHDKYYRSRSLGQSMDVNSMQHFYQHSSSQVQASSPSYSGDENAMPYHRGHENMSPLKMRRLGLTVQDTRAGAESNHAEQITFPSNHVTNWHDQSSLPNLKQDTRPFYDKGSDVCRDGVVHQHSIKPNHQVQSVYYQREYPAQDDNKCETARYANPVNGYILPASTAHEHTNNYRR